MTHKIFMVPATPTQSRDALRHASKSLIWEMRLKAIKNKTEIKYIKNAMIKDGVALTRLFMWLEKTLLRFAVKRHYIRYPTIVIFQCIDLFCSFGKPLSALKLYQQAIINHFS